MTAMIDIAALDDIPRQGARAAKTPAGCVTIFRTADDQVFALEDCCPHKGGPLSEGIVHGTQAICPLHAMVFHPATGMALGADEGSVQTYPARTEGGRVFLDASFLHCMSAA